jgi:hypothetical protein
LARARALGLDAARFLAENDSTGFFERLGDLLAPGPTFTNVNDLRAILVDTSAPNLKFARSEPQGRLRTSGSKGY